MEFILGIIDIFIHLDVYLSQILADYGTWTYAILFLVIFLETGFVVTPFLPGDSLLFAAGTFAALGSFNPILLGLLLIIAAILGDTVNYWIGHKVGDKVFTSDIKWIKKDYIHRTQEFFNKYGGKTIFLARFVPIIRTFAPFISGVGKMKYGYFLFYNVVGGITWVALFLSAGYFFGNIPFVKHNFSLVILAIIILSLVPAAFEAVKARKKNSNHNKAQVKD
ncbi:DedA family protein [Chloroflexota bacterium]